MLKTTTCNFFWFSTLYWVGRGTSDAFLKGKQRFFLTSVVKHIQFVKLHKCPKTSVQDCSWSLLESNARSHWFIYGHRTKMDSNKVIVACSPTNCLPYNFALNSNYITNHLITGPLGNNQFCFPSNLDVCFGSVSRNIEILGKRKITFPLKNSD